MENGKNLLDVIFAHFATVNIHYGTFSELLKGFLLVKVIDKASDQVVKTHYGWYNKLVEGLRLSFQICIDFDINAIDVDGKDLSGEKDDDGKKGGDNRGEDKQADDDNNSSAFTSDTQPNDNSNINITKPKFEKQVGADDNDGDDSTLNAQSDVDTSVDLVKPEEVKKRVAVIAKSGLSKMVNLKLISGFIINCLVDTTFALGNSLSDILDKAVIILENILAVVITNLFIAVFLVNSSDIFVILSNSLVEGDSLANLMVVKSFTYTAIVFIGFIAKAVVIANPYNINPTVNLFATSAFPLPLPVFLWKVVVLPS